MKNLKIFMNIEIVGLVTINTPSTKMKQKMVPQSKKWTYGKISSHFFFGYRQNYDTRCSETSLDVKIHWRSHHPRSKENFPNFKVDEFFCWLKIFGNKLVSCLHKFLWMNRHVRCMEKVSFNCNLEIQADWQWNLKWLHC